ncbi:hypothetical protein B0H19DRAFT_1064576 [Mycena capillaripes]|nr:hypothetical protein B0H19DRAFT_1064576 [Mycena capillaripes]
MAHRELNTKGVGDAPRMTSTIRQGEKPKDIRYNYGSTATKTQRYLRCASSKQVADQHQILTPYGDLSIRLFPGGTRPESGMFFQAPGHYLWTCSAGQGLPKFRIWRRTLRNTQQLEHGAVKKQKRDFVRAKKSRAAKKVAQTAQKGKTKGRSAKASRKGKK